MPCNVDSTLTKFKIGGHVEDLCGDDIAVRVELRLVAPNGATDPSNSAVFAMKPYNVTFDDGCWCTCEIPANTSTVDNDLAIFPNDTYYQLRITAAGQTIVDEQLYLTLEDIQALTPIDTGGACGVVYDINDIRPLLPSTPPTDAFTAAVEDVVGNLDLDGGPYTVDESVAGQVTVTDDSSNNSFTFNAGVGVTLEDNDTSSVRLVDTAGALVAEIPLCDLLDDLNDPAGTAGNTLRSVVVEYDSAGAVVGCALEDRCCTVDQLMVDANGDEVIVVINTDDGSVAYYDETGQVVVPVAPLSAPSAAVPIPDVVVTTQGTALGVAQSGVSDHTVDITILGAEADNAAEIGANGGIYVNPCSTTAPGGATGSPVGAFVDACDSQDLAGATDPETGFPASDYVEGWRQLFTNGVSGSEIWVVLEDTAGALQWHQIA